ncbi:MAG TPA: HupE/UreJ family protein [Candidatus Kryptonia bacterium]|nr:HupE/UreJ family protein [Candidatus Kryptonia bacterium]
MNRRRSAATLGLLAACIVPIVGARAYAHSFDPVLLTLREHQPGVFDVVWKVPGAPILNDATLAPEFPAHCRRIEQFPADSTETSTISFWRIDCGAAGLRGERLAVRGLADLRLDAIVRITWQDGGAVSGALQGEADEFLIPPVARERQDGASTVTVIVSYVRLGIAHIWLGADHLLFVFGLLLLVRSRRVLIETITAFTVAHSIALALAILGVVRVPAAPVEALIALSIVLVATELARSPEALPTLTARYPWVVAFGFGLVHGLGFAGALAEIGLPGDQVPLALFSFNVGVEIGQLGFVLAMLVPLRLFARLVSKWAWARWVPAYAIGAVAVAWALERIERFWMPLRS